MSYFKRQEIIYFSLFILLLAWAVYFHVWAAAIVFGFCIFLGVMILVFPDTDVSADDDKAIYNYTPAEHAVPENCLIYPGDELNFSDEDIISVLTRYLPYFVSLDPDARKKFIGRLDRFIDDKTFRIHDKSGFREMPILISASAVQLSFGLDNYLLPNFKTINIYPEEFVAALPTIHFLEGNVTGHSINISWKYFLRGFQLPEDGENVGLHEMAHAYYYQSFGPCDAKDEKFILAFDKFNICGKVVFQQICKSPDGIYSDYAERNFQEFWAKSAELFFEKPMELRNIYPELYQSICGILKQDPVRND